MTPLLILKNRPLVYAIVNTINGKTYIGKTKCIYRRCYQYIYAFNNRSSKHINNYLYAAMVKYGIESFEMTPLEFVSIENLADREIYWMRHLDTLNRDKGYNLREDSSSGMITHKLTSEKISNRLKKEWAEGKRDGHSEKLRQNWKDLGRRKRQSEILSKIKTKYEYEIVDQNGEVKIGSYRTLIELKLESAMSSFHRKRVDTITLKGHTITRKLK